MFPHHDALPDDTFPLLGTWREIERAPGPRVQSEARLLFEIRTDLGAAVVTGERGPRLVIASRAEAERVFLDFWHALHQDTLNR